MNKSEADTALELYVTEIANCRAMIIRSRSSVEEIVLIAEESMDHLSVSRGVIQTLIRQTQVILCE
jgi:hypothetical protein